MTLTLRELIADLPNIELHGNDAVEISGFQSDSRKVSAGDLFATLKGEHFDGRDFTRQALDQGCSAVLTDRLPEFQLPVPVLISRNVHPALADLAARFYGHPCKGMTMVGVTGTNGKTTTTLLLEMILKEAGHRIGSIGTLAYRWDDRERKASLTTPDPIEFPKVMSEMKADGVNHVVMEVSSHALTLQRIRGCEFRMGVFTNLSRDHLDFHGSFENYFDAKASFFRDYLKGPKGSPTAVVNLDDPFGMRLLPMIQGIAWSFSLLSADAEVSVADFQLDAKGIRAIFTTPKGRLEIKSELLGRLNLYNIAAAATAALALGVSRRHIRSAIAKVRSIDGRLQQIRNHKGYQIVVDFAHTPDAMEKSLECLRELTPGKLWVVFGCGGDRDRGKRPIMGQVAAKYGDLVLVTSDNPRSERPEAIIEDIEPGLEEHRMPRLASPASLRERGRGFLSEPDRGKAIELALASAQPGDVIFIGGKGHETYQIVGDRILDFDDREVAKKFLESMDS